MISFLKIRLSIALVTSLVLANIGTVLACDCETSRFDLPEIELDDSDLTSIVFKGVLTSSKDTSIDDYHYVKYIYTVLSSYREDLPQTIEVLTPASSDMCGFYDLVGSQSIITAYLTNGNYRTAREDCAKSVSKHSDPKKFEQWDKFLHSIVQGRDGTYQLQQPVRYYADGYIDTVYSVPLISYTIRNSMLEGEWKLYSRGGDLIQSGQYHKGRKIGTWFYTSSMYKVDKIIIENKTKTYSEGQLVKEITERHFKYF